LRGYFVSDIGRKVAQSSIAGAFGILSIMKNVSLSPQRRAVAVAVLVSMIATGCGVKDRPPLQPGDNAYPQPGGYNAFPIEQEVQLGKQVAAQADAQLPLLPPRDPVSDYVSTLGTRLARNLPENPYQFDFKVINQKEINAFALPGGPIRLNVGVISHASNEAEVAGVLAHEIAHVYLRHSTRQASKAQIAQIPAAILGGMLGNSTSGQLARLGLEFGLGSVFMKYSRDAESEADYLGAKLMYETGYNPDAMVTFFRKLEEEGGRGGPEFLASHPNPGNRAERVAKAISELPAKQFRASTGDFRQIKSQVAKLKPLTAEQVAQMQQQRQGSIQQVNQGAIAPSGQFQTLNHSVFRMAYPTNWRVYGDQNSPVTIAPEAGVGNGGIAYGVVVSAYQPQQRQSLQQSASDIFQGLQQSNPQMQAAGQLQQTSINGMPAVAVDLASPSPLMDGNGRPAVERDKLVAMERGDGTVLWMLFIAPERDFNALSPTFQQMLQSLQVR
jgi:beta-barrel assembly-enhancing protease